MNSVEPRVREALVVECKRLQENAQYNATAHFESSTILGRLHFFVLGPIPIILGALGGWKGLTDAAPLAKSAAAAGTVGASSSSVLIEWALLAPVLSLVGGLIGSVLAFWNLAETRMRHFTAATAFKSLEHDARRAWEIHGLDEDLPNLKKRVAELGDRYNKLNESSVQTANWAFKRAQKKIKAGTFVTDSERRARRGTSKQTTEPAPEAKQEPPSAS